MRSGTFAFLIAAIVAISFSTESVAQTRLEGFKTKCGGGGGGCTTRACVVYNALGNGGGGYRMKLFRR